MIMRLFFAIALLLLLTECKPKENFRSSDLAGDWLLIRQDTIPPLEKKHPDLSDFGLTPSKTLTFHENKTIEPYYDPIIKVFSNDPWKGDILRFLGQTTRYKIFGDSIALFSPLDSAFKKEPWSKPFAIRKLTHDSLIVQLTKAVRLTYKRFTYNLDTMPSFDAIVLSSGQCLGICPGSSTLIRRDGSVIFFGEGHVEKTGLFEGTVSPELYASIENNFRKADIRNIGTSYSSGYSDGGMIGTTFIKDGKIYKTIRDFDLSGPEKLVQAYYPLLFLNQYIPLKKMESLIKPPHQEYTYNAFIKGNQINILGKSEAFLLWTYLRSAKATLLKPEPRFALAFQEESMPDDDLPAIFLREIITDGQLYTFYFKFGPAITLDLGFNFCDRNFTAKDFNDMTKEDYQTFKLYKSPSLKYIGPLLREDLSHYDYTRIHYTPIVRNRAV